MCCTGSRGAAPATPSRCPSPPVAGSAAVHPRAANLAPRGAPHHRVHRPPSGDAVGPTRSVGGDLPEARPPPRDEELSTGSAFDPNDGHSRVLRGDEQPRPDAAEPRCPFAGAVAAGIRRRPSRSSRAGGPSTPSRPWRMRPTAPGSNWWSWPTGTCSRIPFRSKPGRCADPGSRKRTGAPCTPDGANAPLRAVSSRGGSSSDPEARRMSAAVSGTVAWRFTRQTFTRGHPSDALATCRPECLSH